MVKGWRAMSTRWRIMLIVMAIVAIIAGAAIFRPDWFALDTYDNKGGPTGMTIRNEHYYADAEGGHWEPRRGKIRTCINPLSWSPDLALEEKDRHKGTM